MMWTRRTLLAAVPAAAAISAAQPVWPQGNLADADKVRLAAGWIDSMLTGAASSVEAIGKEFAIRAAGLDPADEPQTQEWKDRAYSEGQTTGFRTWPEGAAEPAFQAAFAGLYSYGGAAVTPERAAEIAALEALVPVLRVAYRSLGFSWVYVTTADEAMVIYPFVPIAEAVNNGTPTEAPYYQAADFAGKSVGWTAPYLDLVGAGMMITASYPVYSGDALLGVASRDITLDELTSGVLRQLAEAGEATALVVDGRGLAIGASDDAVTAEIKRVNTDAGAAVLHYRTAAGLERGSGARSSAAAWANAAVDSVLDAASDTGTAALRSDGRQVQAARIPSTGWYVILVGAQDG
jgi:hypothetical protein